MTNQPQIINEFVEKLIEEKEFGNIDPEVMVQIKEDLTSRVEDRINAMILDHLPKEKLEQFNELLDGLNNEDEIQSFCRNNIDNLDDVLAQALLDFRNTYLNA